MNNDPRKPGKSEINRVSLPSGTRSAQGRPRFELAAPGRHRFVTPSISRQLTIVISILVSAITLGIVFYRQPFRFFGYPLSDLGATRTENGLINLPSIMFFDSGMILSGLVMLSVSARFRVSTVDHRILKRSLTFLTAIGFFVIIFPYNIDDPIHMTGGAGVFGGLWGLTLLLSLELRRTIGGLRFWIVQLVFQGTVLPYAALFAVGLPIKQAFQKPAVAGLMIGLGLLLSMNRPKVQARLARSASPR